MKIKSVCFISNINLGGQVKTASTVSPSHPDRPGSTPYAIELNEEETMFKITKAQPGKATIVKYVPMTFVSDFEVLEEAKPEVKPVTPSVKK